MAYSRTSIDRGQTIINGDNIILYIKDAGVFKPIGCLTSNRLTKTTTFKEIRTKCDPKRTFREVDQIRYTLSFSGLNIDSTSYLGQEDKASHDLLEEKQASEIEIEWRMSTGLPIVKNYFGTGYISSLELEADAGEFSTFTGTLQGYGGIINPIYDTYYKFIDGVANAGGEITSKICTDNYIRGLYN